MSEVNYAEMDRDELVALSEDRDLPTEGTDEELAARLELYDAEQELEADAPAPEEPPAPTEPTPEPPVAPGPPEEPEEAELVVVPAAPAQVGLEPVRYPPRFSNLPPTHWPEKQDPEVRFRILPDGRRVPIVVEGAD